MDILGLLQDYYSFIIVAFVAVYVTVKFFKLKARYFTRKYKKQGDNGEKVARKYLEKEGFKDIKSQKQFAVTYFLNGKKISFDIKPDFVAKKKGEDWIIEVKTGSVATLKKSETRRQILEYSYAFKDYRIALFDATNKKFYEIDFDW